MYTYTAVKILSEYSIDHDKQLLFAVIDCLIVMIISFILALLTTYKDDDFFKDKDNNGIDLGKRKIKKDPKNFKINKNR